MKNLTILRGHGKGGVPEPFQSIVLSRGELWTIVGNTGSGKSRLIKDIEQLSDGDSVTGRHVLLDGAAVPIDCRQRESTRLVAHLGQNMRFVLDTTVEDFLTLHAGKRPSLPLRYWNWQTTSRRSRCLPRITSISSAAARPGR